MKPQRECKITSERLNKGREMSEFEKYSAERKALVERGDVPDWYTTQGYIMFKRKYSWQDETVKEALYRVSSQLSNHVLDKYPEAQEKFYELMWSGKLAPSTPVLCNVGTNRGQPVSCSGSYVGDSIDSFYTSYHEAAMLSQAGYGTSSYLSGIRSRGSKIASGGEADGIVPVFDSFVDTVTKISQGNNRRGNWAGYVDMDSEDFWEMAGYLQKHPADANVGWVFTNDFIHKLQNKNREAVSRYSKVSYIRARSGKGYIWKVDAANELAPIPIKQSGISIKASNLCTEIALPQDEEHTFSCVLSSLNLTHWDDFTYSDVFYSILFLDCVVEEMLAEARGKPGFEKIVRFTEKSRALGLGALGFHSYLQSKMLPWESMEVYLLNGTIFKQIQEWALAATRTLGLELGEPEWCKGTGQRNATVMAIAPNTSSALLCGGVSQGIEPVVANAYNQGTAAGEMTRMNPHFVQLCKDKGIFSLELMRDIAINHNGSVQHLEELSDLEKEVFKTAYELNQFSLVRMAGARQHFIDQAQSLNLFFDTDERYISEVIKEALLNPYIKSLYYQRSLRGIKASKGECEVCSG